MPTDKRGSMKQHTASQYALQFKSSGFRRVYFNANPNSSSGATSGREHQNNEHSYHLQSDTKSEGQKPHHKEVWLCSEGVAAVGGGPCVVHMTSVVLLSKQEMTSQENDNSGPSDEHVV